jgi:hypothetical protein
LERVQADGPFVPFDDEAVTAAEELRFSLKEVQFGTFDVDFEHVTTGVAKMLLPVLFEAEARDANLLPLAFELHSFEIGQVTGGTDVGFVEVKLGIIARLAFPDDAVQGVDVGHMIGRGVPASVFHGLGIGIEHEPAQGASAGKVCQPTGEITDIAPQVSKSGEVRGQQ